MNKLKFKDSELMGVALICTTIGWFMDDWIGGAAVASVWLMAKLLITGDGIPVLFLAFLHQWMQVTLGLFYFGFLGRSVPTIYLSDYRPMVLIGLGCVLSMAVGVRLGLGLIRRRLPARFAQRPDHFVSWPILLGAYVAGVVVEGALIQLSGQFQSLRQIFLTMTTARMGLLYLIMRRLTSPVFHAARFGGLLAGEVALGFTGFFAGFREPLVLAVMALIEIFNPRKMSHMVAVGALIIAMGVSAVMWMGIRVNFRRDFEEVESFSTSQSARMDRITSLGRSFFGSDSSAMIESADELVDRMWAIYFPALAVARVPEAVPHTDGAIATGAVMHVLMPRIFFPNKGELLSDSEMVRRYSGVYVAGREQNTSIAFGYAAEMYIDFGLPMMFLPVCAFGWLMGVAYGWFERTIRHKELSVAVLTVIFWLSLYLFERSSANIIGFALSYMVYLGIPAIALDRFLYLKHEKDEQIRQFAARQMADQMRDQMPDQMAIPEH